MRPLRAAIAAATAALATSIALPALADDFTVGDRVLVTQTGNQGTVIAVGQKLPTGGTYIKVHLDRLPADHPELGVYYDTAMAGVKVIGHGAAVAAAPPPAPTHGPAAIQGSAVNVASATKISADLCKQLIRDNYPNGDDYTQTVSFLTFEMGAVGAYEDIAANSVAGLLAHGRMVQSAPIHAKFTVLQHYQNPNADDQLRTYDAKYQCFRSPTMGWTVKMISRLPGGETAQYIHKH